MKITDPSGFLIDDPGTGAWGQANCLFIALSKVLYGTPEYFMEMRRLISNWFRNIARLPTNSPCWKHPSMALQLLGCVDHLQQDCVQRKTNPGIEEIGYEISGDDVEVEKKKNAWKLHSDTLLNPYCCAGDFELSYFAVAYQVKFMLMSAQTIFPYPKKPRLYRNWTLSLSVCHSKDTVFDNIDGLYSGKERNETMDDAPCYVFLIRRGPDLQRKGKHYHSNMQSVAVE